MSRSASSRVMGGLDAGYGQFPWTAHIKIRGPHGIDKASILQGSAKRWSPGCVNAAGKARLKR